MTGPTGVFDVLDGALQTDPDAPALVTASARLSYCDFDRLSDRAAGAWLSLGVRPGDRVAVSLPNDVDIVVAFHGAMRLGAVWIGVNQALAPPEKAYLLADSGASLALVPSAADAEGFGGVPLASLEEWRSAVAAAKAEPPDAPAADPLAPAAIAYTSGTTGYPKGAVHCQAGLIMPGAGTVARRGWDPSLRKGDSLPLTILNMHTLTTLLTAQAGGTAVIMERGDVASIIETIRAESVNVWNGVPAQLYTMVGDSSIDPGDLATLDEVWVGGADCPDRLREAFESRFGVKVSRTYGLTEAPALVCIDDIAGDRPPGTSGRPLDHIALSTPDGELVLSPVPEGPWAGRFRPMLGYWGHESLDEPVLRTGDLGEIEPTGHLRVVGRKNQVIIRGGANVYPAEVERVLMEAPGVGACAVVGVPDVRLGERVGAAIEPRPGISIDQDALLEHCRAALAAYKVPERLVVVDRLPRNQMGKVPRAEVVKLLGG